MILRRLRRAVALAIALASCILRYWVARLRGPMTMERRALWLQEASKGVLESLGIRYAVYGGPPVCGLVVSNHLSYLDVLILSAVMPCFFIAKAEVDRWPIFGKAARAGGTLFLDRDSMASANQVASKIAARLVLSIPVLLFPEATSSDGTHVLPFHSRLIHPATDRRSCRRQSSGARTVLVWRCGLYRAPVESSRCTAVLGNASIWQIPHLLGSTSRCQADA